MICPTAGYDYTQVYQNNKTIRHVHVIKWWVFSTCKQGLNLELIANGLAYVYGVIHGMNVCIINRPVH